MPKTYYDSELTGAQIEDALEAIHGVVTPSNNGKVLYIDNGQIKAASASRWGHGAVLEPLSVTANGDYTPPTGTDGFDSVHVAVPGATLTTKSITQNGTYNASQDNADGYSSVTVNVSGGGSAVIQPLSVTQNGTYNPPSGVDGYAPVTVNVSGGSGGTYAFIVVDYPVGATCTASNGSVLITAPDTSGHAVFAIPSAGTWTISAAKDGNSSAEQVVISIYGTSDNITLRLLPAGYTGVEYLEIGSSAGPYIDIAYALDSTCEFEVKAQYTGTPNNNSWLFGAYASGRQTNVGYTQNTIYLQTGGRNVPFSFDTLQHVYASKQDAFYYDGTVQTGATPNWANTVTTPTRMFYIGDGSYSNNCRMYRCKIWKSGNLVRDFVPCYRNSDNEPGMYDLINNAFYANNGTGSFILGPEV